MSSLGYIWCMSKEILVNGEIVSGKKLGTKLGFPTVNIKYRGSESGVFAGEILLGGKWFKSVIHVGKKPTIVDKEICCEVHILEFSSVAEREIFSGRKVSVRFMKKIRNTKKFKNLDELKEKISRDVEFAKSWYNLRKL